MTKTITAKPDAAAYDFPLLRKDSCFLKLGQSAQDELLDYCQDDSVIPYVTATDDAISEADRPQKARLERENSAILMSDTLDQLDKGVGATLLKKLHDDHNVMDRFLEMGEMSWFRHPTLDGKAASGGGVHDCQKRYIQMIFLLAHRAFQPKNSDQAVVLWNTIDSLYGRVGMALASSSSEIAKKVGSAPHGFYEGGTITLFHDRIGLGTGKVTEEDEVLRKIAHEVNHSIRGEVDTGDKFLWMLDETFAYLTEYHAAGYGLKRILVGKLYAGDSPPLLHSKYGFQDLFKDGGEGKKWFDSFKYTDDPYTSKLIWPPPSPYGGNSWNPEWNVHNKLKG